MIRPAIIARGEDIAAGILAAAFPGEATTPRSDIYNLGSGSTQTLRTLMEDILAQLGLKVDLRFGIRNYARFEPRFLVADIARAQRELDWQPRKNLAFAVWELAQASFSTLQLKRPDEWIQSQKPSS